jgi:branched-chain amino acid aminotransferase
MFYKGVDYIVNERKIGPLTQKLYDEIQQIQYGEKEDPFGWRIRVD